MTLKIIKGNFGECRFIDNMDMDQGLPSLDNKSWDVCLTDPPYNIKYKKPSGLGVKPAPKNKYKITYSDDLTRDKYSKWCEYWFKGIMNCSKGLIFSPGRMNLDIWYDIKTPYDYIIWYKKNAQGGARASHFAREEPFLIYGKLPNKFKGSVLDIFVINGFLCTGKYVHPVPKSINLWKEIIKQLKPISVLDPFLGSGTTAEVCEGLGIKWLGYEIMEEYTPDIERRIKKGINDYKYYKKIKQRRLI